MVEQSKDKVLAEASYEEEEAYAKQRKQKSKKFETTANELQEVIETAMSDSSQLGLRTKSIQILEQLRNIMNEQIIENKNQ